MKSIPISVGILTISFGAAGCSDAKQAGAAFEKVCKANCDCPDNGWAEYWDDVKNCKKACSGYATLYEAELADSEEEPCGEIDAIIRDLAKCAKESCGDDRDECIDRESERFFECWPTYDYYYDYGSGARIPNPASPIRVELRNHLLYGPLASNSG